MYVHPFWFGVICTLFTQTALFVIGAIIHTKRKR